MEKKKNISLNDFFLDDTIYARGLNSMSKVGTITKMIVNLSNNNLLNFLQKEEERMSKDDFNNYYRSADTVRQMIFESKSEKKFLDKLEKFLRLHSKKLGFNYYNYVILKEENLINLLPEFNNSFRGNIVDVLNKEPNSEHIIFKTYNINKGEEGEFGYYAKRKISYHFKTYEEALFFSMFPNHYDSVNVLYKSELKNKE